MPAQNISQSPSASTSHVKGTQSSAKGSKGGNAPQDAAAFANFLQHSLSKKAPGAAPGSLPAKAPAPLAEFGATKTETLDGHVKTPLDLSVLGEVEEGDGKNPIIKFSDILAEISHESSAPQGTQIINLKTVLGSKDDDPKLINQDLVALVPPQEQKSALKTLINGAKQELKDILSQRIPKGRVPTTLKGLVEMAIRFNIPVEDVKLETIPKSKIGDALIQRFKIASKGLMPTPASKVTMASILDKEKHIKADKKDENNARSPLEKMLNNPSQTPQTVQAATTAMTKTAADDKKADKKIDKDSPLLAKDQHDKQEVAAVDQTTKRQDTSTVAQTGKTISAKNTLEDLLTSAEDKQEGAESTKETHENLATHKSDAVARKEGSLDLKMAESRQFVSQLSQDIKEAMEEYKPPFTKLKMKLKPERLGELDVTMVQRGNSVHINLSSNSTALNILQQNANELKTALNQAGLGDTSMNFTEHQGNKEQQQQQQQHSTHERYQEMAQLADGDIEMLELVVPKYG